MTTRHGPDHTLNRRIYRFAAGLEGVVVSPDARAGRDALDSILVTGWERRGCGRFRAMVTKG